MFPEFIQLTVEEKEDLWNNSIFVFDTNVLLQLYKYSKTTREDMIKALQLLGDKIWIPNHVAYEYLKNRDIKIYEAKSRFSEIEKSAKTFISETEKQLNLSDVKDAEIISDLKSPIENWINEQRTRYHIDFSYLDDNILNELLQILDGKIGNPFDKDMLDEIYKEGEKRYSNSIPPGYGDIKKTSTSKIWRSNHMETNTTVCKE